MDTERTTAEIGAALAGVRRRARLLEQAWGAWSWRELWYPLTLVIAGILVVWGLDDDVSRGTLGLILVVATLAGWRLHRVNARVDALRDLLTEIGYSREA